MNAKPENLIKGGIYEHYKGKRYKVHDVVRHSETLYENDLGKMWVRPKEMFLELVEINGEQVPRFRRV